MKKSLSIFILAMVLAGCSLQTNPITPESDVVAEAIPTPTPSESVYTPTDPIEMFLVELTKSVDLPFDNPVKADIFWNEGDTSNTLKTFFGDSFLISEQNSTLEKEKIVSEYLVSKGFVLMKFNGSIGDDSRKMGYRKDNLICKTDYSTYPDESAPHLVVYCSDANKGTLRK